jgi:hypothetical protein
MNICTAVYQEADTKHNYIKRFTIEPTEKRVEFVEPVDKMILFTFDKYPRLQIIFDMKLRTKGAESEIVPVHEFIGVKGVKAKGKKLTVYPVKKVEWLEPLQITEPAKTAEENATAGIEAEIPLAVTLPLIVAEKESTVEPLPEPLIIKKKTASKGHSKPKDISSNLPETLPNPAKGKKPAKETKPARVTEPEISIDKKTAEKKTPGKKGKMKSSEEIKGEQMELF